MAGFLAEGMNFVPREEGDSETPSNCHSSTCCVEFMLGASGVRVGGTEVGQSFTATEAGTRQMLGIVGTFTLEG